MHMHSYCQGKSYLKLPKYEILGAYAWRLIFTDISYQMQLKLFLFITLWKIAAERDKMVDKS